MTKRPVWAIVPAKSLLRGKSRLRPVLDDGDRARFAQALLEHVLDVLGACDLDGRLVATDGDDVASIAQERGANVLRDRAAGGAAFPPASAADPPRDRTASSLADVVDRALVEVASRGARAAVVLMADLPRIQPADVRALLEALEDADVAIVCDHLGRHTNALALAPPTVMPTHFGCEDSFAAHCTAARARGLRVAQIASATIAFDVDVPADHRCLAASRLAIET